MNLILFTNLANKKCSTTAPPSSNVFGISFPKHVLTNYWLSVLVVHLFFLLNPRRISQSMACSRILHWWLIFPAMDLHWYGTSHIFSPMFAYFCHVFPRFSCDLGGFPRAASGNTRPPRRPCAPVGQSWWRKSGPWRETRRWELVFCFFLLGKSWGHWGSTFKLRGSLVQF